MPQQADERGNQNTIRKKLSKREHAFIFHLLENRTPVAAARLAGFSESVALRKSNEWIRATREESSKPHLWDAYRKSLDNQLRVADIDAAKVIREISLISFSSIDAFIDFPSKQDALDEQAKDAETREFMGIASDEDRVLIEENKIVHKHSPRVERAWKSYRAGSHIKLKAIEDIPREMMPVIQSIKETKDGIEIKLHSKMDALEKLCKIMKLVPKDDAEEQETIDREINLIVKGSRSPLLIPQSSTAPTTVTPIRPDLEISKS